LTSLNFPAAEPILLFLEKDVCFLTAFFSIISFHVPGNNSNIGSAVPASFSDLFKIYQITSFRFDLK
jgi:hypothetical protein